MSGQEDKYTVVILLFILIFMNEYDTTTTTIVTSIKWARYRVEGKFFEASCSSNETRFNKEDILDPIWCCKICHFDDDCMSVFFQPENHQCIGCQHFLSDAPVSESPGFMYLSNRELEIDCKEILERNKLATSGVYEILLSNSKTTQVYCDMDTDGGGWTVFQKIFDHSVNFATNLSMYENGFGDINGEFWLGFKHIKELTEMTSELRYDVSSVKGKSGYEKYNDFKIIGPNYQLFLGDNLLVSSGLSELTSSRLADAKGADFSTIDHGPRSGCIASDGGGWWYPYEPDCAFILNMNAFGMEITKDRMHNSEIVSSSSMMFRRV